MTAGSSASNNDNPSAMAVSGGMIINSSTGPTGPTGPSHPSAIPAMGSHLWTTSGASAANSKGNNSYLLSQISDEDQSDDGGDERKKRSLFVEELVLASLANCKIEDDQC